MKGMAEPLKAGWKYENRLPHEARLQQILLLKLEFP